MQPDPYLRLLAEWGPLLLLVVVWVLFMRQMYRRSGPQQTALAEQKRHNDALERILENHEARIQKLEAEKRG
jgi:type II secretory pathway component PulM